MSFSKPLVSIGWPNPVGLMDTLLLNSWLDGCGAETVRLERRFSNINGQSVPSLLTSNWGTKQNLGICALDNDLYLAFSFVARSEINE
jgi:hypothetical protein